MINGNKFCILHVMHWKFGPGPMASDAGRSKEGLGLVLEHADWMTSLPSAASDHPLCAVPLCACQALVPGVACTSAPDADFATRSAAARLPGPGIPAPSQAGRAQDRVVLKVPRCNRLQRFFKSSTARAPYDQCNPINWDPLETSQETRCQWNGQVHIAYIT